MGNEDCGCGKPSPGPHGGKPRPGTQLGMVASPGARYTHTAPNGTVSRDLDFIGAQAAAVRAGGGTISPQ